MNRKFLEELGLEKDAIDKVMAEHGKTIQELKPAQEEYEGLRTEKATLEEQLTELQATLQTKDEALSGVEEIKQELEKHKLQNLKTNIAIQANIPLELANRLSGSTEEELKADAESLAGFVNKPAPLPLKPTEPQTNDEDGAYKSLLENLNLEGE